MVHHFIIHGYLFDLHDIQFMNIKSHEFWEITFLLLAIALLYISNFVKIKATKNRIYILSLSSISITYVLLIILST